MAAPVISPFSPAPNRQTDSREQFTVRADTRMTEENRLTGELNALSAWMNTTAGQVDQNAEEAMQDAQSAAQSAGQSQEYRNQAEGFKNAASDSATLSDQRATAAGNSASGAASSAGLAAGAAGDAEVFKTQAQEFRDQAEQFRDEAQEIVIGSAIDDTALTPTQVRSAQNASIGHFRNVPLAASGTIEPLDFAQITATGASITVTLPVAPLEGALVMVGNLTDRRDHRIAVGAAKVKGQDAAGFILIDKPHFTITLKYVNAAYGWEILQ